MSTDLLKPLLIVHKSFESNRVAFELLASHFRLKSSTTIEPHSIISNEARLSFLFVELSPHCDIDQVSSKVASFVESHRRSSVMFILNTSGRREDQYNEQKEWLSGVYEDMAVELATLNHRSVVTELYDDLSEALLGMINSIATSSTNYESNKEIEESAHFKTEARECMNLVLGLRADNDNDDGGLY